MMDKKIKSGKAILDEFFEDIISDDQLDPGTVTAIIGLHKSGKLTDNNLNNSLLELREAKGDGEIK